MHDEPQPRELPVVEYEGQHWYLDERLRELRNVSNPHDHHPLDDLELAYFKALVHL